MRTTQAANASLVWTPQISPHHPARSNRHHLQQPHKELTTPSWRYWSARHSPHEKIKVISHQIRSKSHSSLTWQMQPSMLLVMCRPLPPNHLIPSESPPSSYSSGGTLCLSIHGRCRTQTSILSWSMPVVFKLFSFLFSLSFSIAWALSLSLVVPNLSTRQLATKKR